MTMLDTVPSTPPAEPSGSPRVTLLARDIVLLVWDVPQAVRNVAPLSVVEGGTVTPNASLRLTRVDGGTRLLWALRRHQQDSFTVCLSAKPLGGSIDVAVEPDASLERVDAAELLRDVDGAGCVAFVSTLFNVWGPLFRLQRSSEFIGFLRAILRHLVTSPAIATPIARAGDELVLVRTSLASDFGKVDAIYGLSGDGPTRISARPHRNVAATGGRDSLHLLVGSRFTRSRDALVILIGPSGLSVRTLAAAQTRLPSIARWLSKHGETAPQLREHVLGELAVLSDVGRSIALEAQLRAPLQPRRVVGQALTPTAEIVDALSTSSGTLVTGWYSDPSNLVARVEALGADAQDLTSALHRFPVTVSDPKSGAQINATGFVALAPSRGGAAPILQPRFRLHLKSGSHHTLVPPTQPISAADARAAALRAVPPEHVSEDVLARILAPVIADLHARTGTAVGQPTIHTFGTPLVRPKASVVIPLYKVLDYLRFQIAAFAADAWFRTNAELIFVLDSPDQSADVQHLLGGLYLIYGVPMLLVVMERNAGYARACNTGASVARGGALAMVNSDVIPTASGWLQALVSRLGGPRRIGAVGPKLLFEDGSIQHAGMYFAKDHRGRWLNHHFHKGMPRSYAPAAEERVVPAVTGACLVMRRALFEQVGGFTEDYVIGDYEDSDLCLKITTAGRRIIYTPDVELYHLERKSMSVNADYMRGIAWQYNCALHGERWGGLIAAISAAGQRRRRERRAFS
jgi:GT2 family glycosyltransferase